MEAILEHFFDELEATYLLALRETLEERTLKRAFLAWKALAIRRKSSTKQQQRRKQIATDATTLTRRSSSLRKSLSKLFSKIDITAIPDKGKERALPQPPTRPVSTQVVVARRKSSIMRTLSFSKRVSMPPPPEPMQAAAGKGSPALRPAPSPPIHLTYKFHAKDNDKSVFQLDMPNQNHHNNISRADGSSNGLFHFRNSKATGENGRVSSQQDLLQRSSSYRFSDYYRKQRDQVELLHNLKLKAEARKQERKKSKKQSLSAV